LATTVAPAGASSVDRPAATPCRSAVGGRSGGPPGPGQARREPAAQGARGRMHAPGRRGHPPRHLVSVPWPPLLRFRCPGRCGRSRAAGVVPPLR